MKTISICVNQLWELKEIEKTYQALKALLLLFGDAEPERAIDLMLRTVQYAERRMEKQKQKEEVL